MKVDRELAFWSKVTKFDRAAVALADRHYSRRKVGAPQFMPPGETIVLLGSKAVWGWWRPHPDSGLKATNGFDGWTCTIFRNEGEILSSDLILEAERYLQISGKTCGPSGMLTYVFDSKIRSTNPGFCFKLVGWVVIGRSADRRKTLLWKPFEFAGIKACGISRDVARLPQAAAKRIA